MRKKVTHNLSSTLPEWKDTYLAPQIAEHTPQTTPHTPLITLHIPPNLLAHTFTWLHEHLADSMNHKTDFINHKTQFNFKFLHQSDSMSSYIGRNTYYSICTQTCPEGHQITAPACILNGGVRSSVKAGIQDHSLRPLKIRIVSLAMALSQTLGL